MAHLPPRSACYRLSLLVATCLAAGESTSAAAQDPSLDHWAFRPIRTTQPTTGGVATLAKTLDQFVARKRAAANLQASPSADKQTLVRRLYLDVHGLPPTPEQVHSFLTDERPDAYAQLVEAVLASPRYGERWAQHWLDVVRYADTNGFETNTPRDNAWPYRDWVIRSLNRDLPYDRFVFEQVAGNTPGSSAADGHAAATGFLVAGPADGVAAKDEPSIRQARHDRLDEIIKATGSTLLGLTIGCARCHDHKFDPVTQNDYYAMQAVFAGVRYEQRPIPDPVAERKAAAERSRARSLRQQLDQLEPITFRGDTIQLDDLQATVLTKASAHERGVAGKQSCWDATAGRDLLAYKPQVEGVFHLWACWRPDKAHTPNAQYLLDLDGNPDSKGDQTLLASIDQSRSSGLHDLGKHLLQTGSSILLRAGGGSMTAADTLVLQSSAPSAQPRTRPSLRRVVNAARNIDRFEPVIAKFLRFTILATNGKVEPCIDELEVHSVGTDTSPAQNVALAKNGVKATSSGNYANNPKHLLPHIHDGRFGNGRSWISDTSGKGWVELEFPSAHTIDRVTWGRDRNRRYKDRLPTRYEISVATKPGDWRVVASSEDRSPIASALAAVNPSLAEISNELSASEARLTKLNKRSVVFAGQFTQKPAATRFLYRGNPMSERHLVTPAIPAVFGHAQIQGEAEHDRRTALARWIISPDNPLTSRVIVNRIWQHHFGAGLVDTPSDFGHAGQAPTHPALLDWIARALVDGGWSLKHIHRIILHSTTYKQGGRPRPDAVRKDSGNRMLWRFAPRRLEAEVIRDSILASSGALDLTMGGPGFSLFAPNSNYVRVYVPKARWTPDTFRRMVYAHKVRMEPGGVFGAFDCPDAGQAAPKRSRSTTALQSLNLFNSTFVMQQADTLAKRIRGSHKTASGQVRMAFNLTLGRAPSTTEAANSMDLASKHGLPALCRVLFNTNEFLVLP